MSSSFQTSQTITLVGCLVTVSQARSSVPIKPFSKPWSFQAPCKVQYFGVLQRLKSKPKSHTRHNRLMVHVQRPCQIAPKKNMVMHKGLCQRLSMGNNPVLIGNWFRSCFKHVISDLLHFCSVVSLILSLALLTLPIFQHPLSYLTLAPGLLRTTSWTDTGNLFPIHVQKRAAIVISSPPRN